MIYDTHPEFEGDDAYRTFRDLDLTVEQTCRTLGNVADAFDTIAVTGISGLVVGAPVALRLRKPLVVLRKSSPDDIVGGGSLLGARDLGPDSRVLFLDDLISTGTTLSRVSRAVEGEGGHLALAYLYSENDLRDRDDFFSYLN